MKKFALIGYPIKHSLSPALFKEAFPSASENQEPVQHEPMVYDLVEEPSIDKSIARLKQEGYCGANVTSPFKESVMQFVTDPDPVTKTLGATNLILFKDGRTYGYNTDYLAVRRMVREFKTCIEGFHKTGRNSVEVRNVEVASRKVQHAAIVIGCGGAGKAAALACRDEGLDTIITNRTLSKAEGFAKAISEQADKLSAKMTARKTSGRIKAVSIAEAKRLLEKLLGHKPDNTLALAIYAIPAPDGILSEILKSCNQIQREIRTPRERIPNSPDSRIRVIEANYKDPCLNLESGLKWLRYQAECSFRLFKLKI